MWACCDADAHLPVLEVLLAHNDATKADPQIFKRRDKLMMTVVMVAALYNSSACFSLLVDMGASCLDRFQERDELIAFGVGGKTVMEVARSRSFEKVRGLSEYCSRKICEFRFILT